MCWDLGKGEGGREGGGGGREGERRKGEKKVELFWGIRGGVHVCKIRIVSNELFSTVSSLPLTPAPCPRPAFTPFIQSLPSSSLALACAELRGGDAHPLDRDRDRHPQIWHDLQFPSPPPPFWVQKIQIKSKYNHFIFSKNHPNFALAN